jgi:hypothetical protein
MTFVSFDLFLPIQSVYHSLIDSYGAPGIFYLQIRVPAGLRYASSPQSNASMQYYQVVLLYKLFEHVYENSLF